MSDSSKKIHSTSTRKTSPSTTRKSTPAPSRPVSRGASARAAGRATSTARSSSTHATRSPDSVHGIDTAPRGPSALTSALENTLTEQKPSKLFIGHENRPKVEGHLQPPGSIDEKGSLKYKLEKQNEIHKAAAYGEGRPGGPKALLGEGKVNIHKESDNPKPLSSHGEGPGGGPKPLSSHGEGKVNIHKESDGPKGNTFQNEGPKALAHGEGPKPLSSHGEGKGGALINEGPKPLSSHGEGPGGGPKPFGTHKEGPKDGLGLGEGKVNIHKESDGPKGNTFQNEGPKALAHGEGPGPKPLSSHGEKGNLFSEGPKPSAEGPGDMKLGSTLQEGPKPLKEGPGDMKLGASFNEGPMKAASIFEGPGQHPKLLEMPPMGPDDKKRIEDKLDDWLKNRRPSFKPELEKYAEMAPALLNTGSGSDRFFF